MPWRILTLLLALMSWPAQATTATARIERLSLDGAELRGVVVRLHWPDGAAQGDLRIDVARLDVPALGLGHARLRWDCPLAGGGEAAWRCEGPLQAQGVAPMRLAVDLSVAHTDAVLSQGARRIHLARNAAVPDLTTLSLARVPLAWAQSLLDSAWPGAGLAGGVVDGSLALRTSRIQPMRVDGRLAVSGLALESADASVAAGDVDAAIRFAYRPSAAGHVRVEVEGSLRAGELLVGNAYVVPGEQPLAFALVAQQHAQGWTLPSLFWRDGRSLAVEGRGALAADGGLDQLALSLRSDALEQLPARYLSGWLGLAGLGELQMAGALAGRIEVAAGVLDAVDLRLDAVDLRDPGGRFRIEGLHGDLQHAAGGAPRDSELRWAGGALHGLAFGPIRLALRSEAGSLRLRAPARMAMLGGEVRLEGLALHPPAGDTGLRIGFGLALDALDLGQLAQSLGWPAFRGTLSGRIPSARYADDRLAFDGGLSMSLFEGRVDVAALSMERPFGVAPTLSADLALHDLDLLGITEVFDFGSISGRLHGRIDGLRLVDWTATAFDAELHTEPRRGVRQRISQRAVQDISSVGDASFATSLQGQLIGLFDDFGYRRIGIGCRLANEVCRMSGLHSAGNGFTIVEGAGVPRLQVVGFNREVDWPTLVERLASVASGDVAPVVE